MSISVVRGSRFLAENLFQAGLSVICAILVGAGTAGRATAQTSISPNFGVTIAGGNYGAYTETAPSASLRISQALSSTTGIFVEGGLDRFEKRELQDQPEEYAIVMGPDMQTIRFILGLERELIPEDLDQYSSWSTRVRAGVGLALMESDDFQLVGGTETMSFSSTSPLISTGLSFGYRMGAATFYVDGGVNWARVDEDDTLGLASLAPFYVKSFDTAFTYPYSLGVRLTF